MSLPIGFKFFSIVALFNLCLSVSGALCGIYEIPAPLEQAIVPKGDASLTGTVQEQVDSKPEELGEFIYGNPIWASKVMGVFLNLLTGNGTLYLSLGVPFTYAVFLAGATWIIYGATIVSIFNR